MSNIIPFAQAHSRLLHFENLEQRLVLAAACMGQVDSLPTGDIGRASQAVNCLGYELYEHIRQESGNLLLSPLSISTALAMVYAGADGETAAQMREALHFGADDSIHDSFRALIDSLSTEGVHDAPFELALANAIWPGIHFQVKEEFTGRINDDYGGHSQNLDYSQGELAKETINAFVENETRGRIRDLIKRLSPDTVMVLTNSIYFKAFWEFEFVMSSPQFQVEIEFTKADGTVSSVPALTRPAFFSQTDIEGFRVIELPYKDKSASMVLVVPDEQHAAEDLSSETLMQANAWLDGRPAPSLCLSLTMPKFKTTASSNLKPVLEGLGMPMSGDFSRMTDEGVLIDQIGHKAFIAVDETGTEAAAATFVGFAVCFAAGTPVLTPDGEKPIEELNSGDMVLARNEHDVEGKVEPKRIQEVFGCRNEVVKLHLGGQIIRTTLLHRFYEKEQGWTQAKDLRVGDLLASKDGEWLQVELVDVSDETDDVYNFRVADHHTYFVGGKEWGFGLWTHNCYSDESIRVDRPFHYFIRDNATSALLFMGRVSDPSVDQVELLPEMTEPEEQGPIPGDADGNNEVDFADFLILSRNFGQEEDAVFSDGDFNDDGAVGFADFLILQSHFGKKSPLPA